jgi:hypothetical protein
MQSLTLRKSCMACKAMPVSRRHTRLIVRSGSSGHSQTEIAEVCKASKALRSNLEQRKSSAPFLCVQAEKRLDAAKTEAKAVELTGDAKHKAAA